MTEVKTAAENELLAQAREGDDAALSELLRRVQPQLYRFSLKMCRHEEDAEDVLQDSMLTLARSFRDFRGASSLSTWLYTITRSFCIKKRRRSKFAPKQEESWESIAQGERNSIVSPNADPESATHTGELWEQVQRGIQALEPNYREVLVLRDVEGLTAKEVAEVCEISVSAVKSRLHRARTQLREFLTGEQTVRQPGCPNISQIFSEYLEGDLSSDLCADMEAHVETCESCAKECDGLRAALRVCSASSCEVPTEVQERVRSHLNEALAKAKAEL
jgi:RNA polymerase sigma-70 factor (ECF subfamily)